MRKKDGSSPASKDDLEIAVSQIASAVSKALENVATKDNIANMATKDDIQKLEGRIGELDAKTSDILRRVIDLEHNTPTRKEFDDL